MNADSVAIGKRMRRPLPDYNIHVCGEAYPGIQGFIEGPLTSTGLVFRSNLGLDGPEWLPTTTSWALGSERLSADRRTSFEGTVLRVLPVVDDPATAERETLGGSKPRLKYPPRPNLPA